MKLKTYVVNLEKSTVRKNYMQGLLSGYDFLDVEFIKAVDGRLLSEEERQSRFDYKKSKTLYGRTLNAGEVGCTLSHRKIYESIVHGSEPYALILEDDVAIQRDLGQMDIDGIDKILDSPQPRVLMLSGDYSFYRKKAITRIYSAVGTYAYLINRAGAQLLTKKRPCTAADDWLYYKRDGLRMFAIYPYMIDANVNMEFLGSEIRQDSWSIDRSQMSLSEVIIGVYTGLVKKLFKLFKHFEYKARVINDVVVETPNNPPKQ